MAEKTKNKLNVWRAGIISRNNTVERGLYPVLKKIRENIDRSVVPVTIERIEQLSLCCLKIKTFGLMLDRVNAIIEEIPLIYSGNVSPETHSYITYLKGVSLSDPNKDSQDLLKPLFNKVKVTATPDHDAAVCLGKEMISTKDTVKNTIDVCHAVDDFDYKLLRILARSPKYKAYADEELNMLVRPDADESSSFDTEEPSTLMRAGMMPPPPKMKQQPEANRNILYAYRTVPINSHRVSRFGAF
jgi:hypothetical protein